MAFSAHAVLCASRTALSDLPGAVAHSPLPGPPPSARVQSHSCKMVCLYMKNLPPQGRLALDGEPRIPGTRSQEASTLGMSITRSFATPLIRFKTNILRQWPNSEVPGSNRHPLPAQSKAPTTLFFTSLFTQQVLSYRCPSMWTMTFVPDSAGSTTDTSKKAVSRPVK